MLRPGKVINNDKNKECIIYKQETGPGSEINIGISLETL